MAYVHLLRHKLNGRYWSGPRHFTVNLPEFWSEDRLHEATRFTTEVQINRCGYNLHNLGIETEQEHVNRTELPDTGRRRKMEEHGKDRACKGHPDRRRGG